MFNYSAFKMFDLINILDILDPQICSIKDQGQSGERF